MSHGCKVSNVLIVSEDAKARAKGARALTTCVNSLVQPKVKLRPN
jgi:hypothetical protein